MELKIRRETAKEIYDESSSGLKKILVDTFGIDYFKKTDFKDLKTFDDLCKATGTTQAEFEAKWNNIPVSQTLKTVAKFEILSEGINLGWKPNTLDTNERKWFPYFSVSSSRLDFSGSGCSYDYAYAFVGFPFCFKTKEQSDHAGRQFIKLWEELILRKIA